MFTQQELGMEKKHIHQPFRMENPLIRLFMSKLPEMIFIIFLFFCLGFCSLSMAQYPKNIFEPENLAPRKWWIIGTFPNSTQGSPEGIGLERDFLASWGGETKTQILPAGQFFWEGVQTMKAIPLSMNSSTIVDFKIPFSQESDYKVSYAYAEWNVRKKMSAKAYFGSDDGAKVWLNGILLHNTGPIGRQLIPDSEQFDVPLVSGKNRLLVKVENGTGEWGFSLKILDSKGQEKLKISQLRRHLESLDPGPEEGTFFLGDTFPRIIWRNMNAGKVMAPGPIHVRWFDPDLKEVTKPGKSGRYGALLESKTLDGYPYSIILTFAKLSSGQYPEIWLPQLSDLPEFGIPSTKPYFSTLNAPQRDEMSRHLWLALREYMFRSENAAIAFSTMEELNQSPSVSENVAWLQTSFMKNAEYQLKLRMKLDGRTPKTLTPPIRLDIPAPELKNGTETEAGIKSGTVKKLHDLCNDWMKADSHGFVVLVTRKGVVVMHEGFGDFTRESRFYPASIGKSIAGLTFARAMDQGLLDVDKPVSSIFPDWKENPVENVTFRWCFNHLTGLSGHASHGGLYNPYLDNSLFVQDAVFEKPGIQHRYNGDGYNLVGKALELTTGKTIWQLLYENLQQPFGEPVTQYDLGFGGQFTAPYLAKVGQMILQDGKYGSYQFYKPGFVKTLLPRKVAPYAPELNNKELEWGIGFTYMMDPEGPRDKGVLGPNVFGHGSASHSVWRIDPDHNMVVVIGRNEYNDRNETSTWITRFMTILAEGVK